MNPTATQRRILTGASVGLLTVVALAACSSSSAKQPTGAVPLTSTPTAARGAGPDGARNTPGTSGQIADLTGTTMQVQNQATGQVAVRWTAATAFTQAVTAAASSIKAGDCVTAIAPSGTAASATSFTAATVVVSAPVNGSCGRGPGGQGGPGGFGGDRQGAPSGLPTGLPSGFPSGVPGRSRQIGALARGSVTSVSGATLVIAAEQFGQNGPSTTNKTVALDASTKITTDAKATASALKVGRCVTARGSSASDGTVTATAVRVSDPVDGQCTIGFGGGFRGPN